MTSKCSTIFVVTDDEMRIFHSVDEMPASLRQQLAATTRGMNSATILIADKGGREEILKAMRRSDGGQYSNLVRAVVDAEAPPQRRIRLSLPFLGRLLLVGCLIYVLWVLATMQ